MDEKQQRIEVGNRLNTLRTKQFNISQEKMAERLGYTRVGYGRIEKGDFAPNIESLNVLYTKYFVNVKWVMYGEGDMMLSEAERIELAKKVAQEETDEMEAFEFERQLKGKPAKSDLKDSLLANLKSIREQLDNLEKKINDL
jgi:transcriptional regulator with XRE-family HTH domain